MLSTRRYIAFLSFSWISVIGGLLSAEELSFAASESFVDETDMAHVWYSKGRIAYEQRHWPEVARVYRSLWKRFPSSPFCKDALFFLGTAAYEMGEEADALEALDTYLRQSHPLYAQEAFELRLLIAERFVSGQRKRILGQSWLPKWQSAEEEALAIFDEVASAFPGTSLAARALLGKGILLERANDPRGASDALQQVTKKFPRDPLAQTAYVELAKMYWEHSKTHFHDPNLLDLAEMNLGRFERAFPSSPRLQEARDSLSKMRERYAAGFVQTARFYHRIGFPGAASVYYASALKQYPEASSAQEAQKQLQTLKKNHHFSTDLQELFEPTILPSS